MVKTSVTYRADPKTLKTFDAYCERIGLDRSTVLCNLMAAFNKASEESIVYGLTFELPLTLNTVKLPEKETDQKKKAVKK
jgi:hypothetical protein